MDQEIEEPPAPPKRNSAFSFLLAVLAIGGSAAGVFVYQMMQGQTKPNLDASGFDVEKTNDQPRALTFSTPEPQVQSSLMAIKGAPTGMRMPGQAVDASKVKFASSQVPPDQKAKEQDFIRKYGATLNQYGRNLDKLTAKYYKSEPVVRDVDKAFANMPRYMAVRAKYAQDGDPFQFARDVIALPEVRGEIAKRMTDPAVWKVAIAMMNETLKTQPAPAPVYDAAKNFMLFDPQMSKYVSDFAGDVSKNVGPMMSGMPLGTDTSAISKVAKDVAPQAAAAIPPGR